MSSITHIQTSKGAPLDGIHNSRAWLKESDCVLQDLIDVVEGSKTMIEHYPMATESIGNAVVYDRDRFVTKTSVIVRWYSRSVLVLRLLRCQNFDEAWS